MTGTNCDLFTHKSSRSYLNHLVLHIPKFTVFSLSYAACKAHAPYHIVICGLSGSTILSCYLTKGTIFRKKVIKHEMFRFSTHFFNISHFTKNSARYYHKWEYVFMYTARYSCRILIKLRDRFLKDTQMSNLMKLGPVEAQLFHADGRTDGRTDRQTDMTTLMSRT